MPKGFTEYLAAAYLRQQGYLVETDIPFGMLGCEGNSDIDILAVRGREVLLVQCKADINHPKKGQTPVEYGRKLGDWFRAAEDCLRKSSRYKWVDSATDVKRLLIVNKPYSEKKKTVAGQVLAALPASVTVCFTRDILRKMVEHESDRIETKRTQEWEPMTDLIRSLIEHGFLSRNVGWCPKTRASNPRSATRSCRS